MTNARSTPPSGSPEPAPAWLWLSREGIIAGCTPAARVLGIADPAGLVGTALVGHLAWDITSQDPDWQQAQWEVLLAAAADQGLKVAAQLAPDVELLLRLEPAAGARRRILRHARPGACTRRLAAGARPRLPPRRRPRHRLARPARRRSASSLSTSCTAGPASRPR
jgi:hypothetical protein